MARKVHVDGAVKAFAATKWTGVEMGLVVVAGGRLKGRVEEALDHAPAESKNNKFSLLNKPRL